MERSRNAFTRTSISSQSQLARLLEMQRQRLFLRNGDRAAWLAIASQPSSAAARPHA
jgi:hypothetical protein